jgi:vacuolar-type H+-ATPase subunit I/STV1
MARRRSIPEGGVSLFPFMSILACLIGILTLLISVTMQVKNMDRKEGQTEEERALAVKNRDLKLAAKRTEKEITTLDERLKKERSTVAVLEKLKDQQIVLRERLDKLKKAEEEAKSDEALQKIAENLKKEVAALKKERPPLSKRMEELQKLLKARKEAPEPPQSVQVRPGGVGLNKARNIFFVDCTSTGIVILDQGKGTKRISKAAIPSNGDYKAFLEKVKKTRDSMVLYLVRRSGNESYLWAANEAETNFDLTTGKLPIPNDGELDLSLFD